jgi:exonuclease SbcC
MRPVRLTMHGFASFREPTEVDFTGADYFALVGPTGAGKSTVIDAMTFALYGSVPRWDNEGVVALALSPTASRGTVSLLFDVGTERYLVARDLRRSASDKVTVREARLDRVAAGATDPDAQSEPIALGRTVSAEVEKLLGLPFDQFCVCVALPQGEFAQFLHAKPAARQKTLTRILGLDIYEQMARQARAEAAEQSRKAEWITEQLGEYAEYTEEAAADARTRVVRLEALLDQVGAALPGLTEHDGAVRDAEQRVARLRSDQAALGQVRLPDHLGDLAPRLEQAESAAQRARSRATEAEKNDSDARSRLADAPDPEPLRRQRAERAELERLTEQLPQLKAASESAGTRTSAAAEARAAAEVRERNARSALEKAEIAATEVTEQGTRLDEQKRQLAAARVPDDVSELDRQRGAATAELEAAVARLRTEERSRDAARKALDAGPDRTALRQARQDLTDLAHARDQLRRATERDTEARKLEGELEQAWEQAERRLRSREEQEATARRADLVGALRSGLVANEACPVCEQVVHRLPGDVTTTDLARAREAVAEATRERDRARQRHREAAEARSRTTNQRQAWSTQVDALRSRLTDPELDDVRITDLLTQADELARASTEADKRVIQARRDQERAEQAVATFAQRAEDHTRALYAARDPLVALGAPPVELGQGLAQAWRILTDWTRAEIAEREDQLVRLRTAYSTAQQAVASARAKHTETEAALQDAHRAHTDAVRAEQDDSRAFEQASRRLGELDVALAEAPPDAELAGQLAELDRLAQDVRAADSELRAAREALREAMDKLAAHGQDLERGWRELAETRDRLVGLGAPTFEAAATTGRDLLVAWAALLDWATVQAAARTEQLGIAENELTEATSARDRARRRLADELAENQVTVRTDRPLTAVAEPAVSAELERARAAVGRIEEHRAKAAELDTGRAEAQQAAQVATLLGRLLSSEKFPRWLAASALDTLVLDASQCLRELSGGQFELAHERGEFVVVDHADADARRPVKTLSGGETFQASLALAIALSEQLATLAADGAARLDSIFLDEGFGTLDESNLDVVASTLENLAAQRDRMVGVITHVPALAERVPVRFVVSRDQHTSSIVREDQ